MTNKIDKNKPTAIVIGAGFGGIALAIRLQSQGFDVTLIENRDKPGGRAYVYEEAGYKFDGGPTVITDPDCLKELFELSAEKLKIISICCPSIHFTNCNGKTAIALIITMIWTTFWRKSASAIRAMLRVIRSFWTILTKFITRAM